MSGPEESRELLSDWTVVVKKGDEVVECDSNPSDSSFDVVIVEGQNGVSCQYHLGRSVSPTDLPEEAMVKNEVYLTDCDKGLPTVEPVIHTEGVEENLASGGNEVMETDGNQVVETDGGFGACCRELNILRVEPGAGPDKELCQHTAVQAEGTGFYSPQCACVQEQHTAVRSEGIGLDPFKTERLHDKDGIPNKDVLDNPDSPHEDSDSDFVCLDQDSDDHVVGHVCQVNLPHLAGAMRHDRRSMRESSIAPGFNFWRPAVAEGHEVGDSSDRESVEDLDDETESSVEDGIDDRIESEQSEVGSANDVGDLSAFADIGDLPIVAGNVARNYIHQPNNRLSTALNTTVALAAILTMGISLGIIMATDLEIEEWQNAYDREIKQVAALEKKLVETKRRQSELHEDRTSEFVAAFVDSFLGAANDFSLCQMQLRNLPAMNCQSVILPDIHASLTKLRTALQVESLSLVQEEEKVHGQSPNMEEGEGGQHGGSVDEERSGHSLLDIVFLDSLTTVQTTAGAGTRRSRRKEETDGDRWSFQEDHHIKVPPELDVRRLQHLLAKEQERTVRWQKLYLAEQRQRLWERQNEEQEDERERAQWKKEDEVEDQRQRDIWEREEEEEDRKERLRWEREEAEEDKRDRERWEREEAEEDKRDRERWEKEKEEKTNLECVQKLMNVNLTFLTHQATRWNTSVSGDFANLSALMSSIAQLKQLVVKSVQEIWQETKNKEGHGAKGHEELDGFEGGKGGGMSLDNEMIARYLNEVMSGLKGQLDNLIQLDGTDTEDDDVTTGGHNSDEKKRSQEEEEDHHGSFANLFVMKLGKRNVWRRTVGKILHRTRKSLQHLGQGVVKTWKMLKGMWRDTRSPWQRNQEQNHVDDVTLTSRLAGKACRQLHHHWSVEKKDLKNVWVDIGCPCVQEVRSRVFESVLNNPCKALGIYSQACNMQHRHLEKQVKNLEKDLGRLLEKDQVKSYHIQNIEFGKSKGRLEEFRHLWDSWGYSELLMEPDREWLRCRLKWWSTALDAGQDHSRDRASQDTCRSVSVYSLFEDLVEKDARRSFFQKAVKISVSDGDDESSDNGMGEESDGTMAQEDVRRGKDLDVKYDDDDKDDGNDGDVENNVMWDLKVVNNVAEKKMKESYEDVYNSDDDDRIEIAVNKLRVDLLNPGIFGVGTDANEEYVDSGSENTTITAMRDNTEGTSEASGMSQPALEDWLLQRAQHRLLLRKQRTKSDWMFDRAAHRSRLRTENLQDDWMFGKAQNRAFLRMRDRESDWWFERAQYRKGKWMKQEEEEVGERGTDTDEWKSGLKSYRSTSDFSADESSRRQRWKKGGKWFKSIGDVHHKHARQDRKGFHHQEQDKGRWKKREKMLHQTATMWCKD